MVILLFVVVFLSVGYSAFEINLFVDDSSVVVRSKSDIRITDFSVESVSDGVLVNYSEYNVRNTSSSVYLPNNDSYVTYKVSVTNFGNVEMVLFDIVGLNSNLIYYFTDDNYVLGDRICDKNNVCNLGVTRDIYITIKFSGDNSDKEYNLDLEFEFVEYDKIVTTFDYVGETQEFVVPYDGVYKIELWGASGGNSFGYTENDNVLLKYSGGNGGYSFGTLFFNKYDKIYFNVGGMGNGNCITEICIGGYNGGGDSGVSTHDDKNYTSSGGGATHVSKYNGGELFNYRNSSYISEIIIVAGGGGGAYFHTFGLNYSTDGGSGGGINGIDGMPSQYELDNAIVANATGGTQTNGGSAGYRGNSGSFGKGGNGTTCDTTACGSSGGGGGYYGGGSSAHSGTGGGSGYLNYLFLDNGITIDGNQVMPTHDGNGTMVGNVGNGYAKITLLELKN